MSINSTSSRITQITRKYWYYFYSIFELITQFAPLTQIIRLFIGLKNEKTCIVTLRRLELRFEVRSAMDVWSIKETFIDRFYERYGCPVSDGWVVVDIGGGIGDFSIFASHVNPANRVYAFEPYPGSFGLLMNNLKRNQISNVKTFQEAIWSSHGNLALDTSTGEPVQFISREISDEGAAGKMIVPCSSLEVTFQRLGIKQCDLMKVDAEGAEYPILFAASDEVLSKVQRMVMEYHDGISQYSHTDLVEYLQRKGYLVWVYPNPVHADLGYLYAELSSLQSR
jgi:FkbM family methyltransferase